MTTSKALDLVAQSYNKDAPTPLDEALITLHKQLKSFATIAMMIAYPRRGSVEEDLKYMDMVDAFQQAFSLEQLEEITNA